MPVIFFAFGRSLKSFPSLQTLEYSHLTLMTLCLCLACFIGLLLNLSDSELHLTLTWCRHDLKFTWCRHDLKFSFQLTGSCSLLNSFCVIDISPVLFT